MDRLRDCVHFALRNQTNPLIGLNSIERPTRPPFGAEDAVLDAKQRACDTPAKNTPTNQEIFSGRSPVTVQDASDNR
jgi:hypothetical protein